MDWVIEFYKDEKGSEPVVNFIENLQPREQAKIIWMIDLLEKTGVNLSDPYTKHIEGALWELRPGHLRVLYFLEKRTFVLLHAFRKKAKKLPVSEKEIALRRMADYLGRREK